MKYSNNNNNNTNKKNKEDIFNYKEKLKNLYLNAYDGKIFKGKFITFKQNKITYKKNINYDIFFTKNTNESYCSLKDNKSSSFLRSKIK